MYMKSRENSPLKAIRVTCTMESTLSALTAALFDIDNSKQWVYATKAIKLLKPISASELIYYSEIEIPWPVANRDFIVDLKVEQDPKTKAVSVIGKNLYDYLPEQKNIVRIKESYSKWLVTPVSANSVKIEYVLEVDPAGIIPAWLINLFATKGPFETMKGLRNVVKQPQYANAKLSYIRE